MRKSQIVFGMVLSCITAFALVSGYHVEPRTAGQSGWTRAHPNEPEEQYVSQVVTMNFDELDSAAGGCYVELFAGGKCRGLGYALAVSTYPGGTPIAYQTATEGVEHDWVKFKLNIAYPESIVRGKRLKFTFTRDGGDDAVACHRDMGIYNLGAMRRLWWHVFLLVGATVAFGARLSFEEHAAVQESLARVHPRMRARWLAERRIEDPYYTSVRTDSGSGLQCIGRWSYGPSYDVDGRTTPGETLVALARGSGVSLLTFSRQDSLSIELLSDINAEGLMCRVKVVGTLLYVGSRKGLEVYNIADERKPVRLSWTPMPLNDFDVQDSLAYTISGDDSFRIYNVSNPASPVFRGACRDSGHLVSVEGNTAFIGDRWGLYVIDVTNPTSPHRIGSWGSAVEQVLARGHLCYVTTFNPSGVPPWITFHVLDASTPSSPYQIGSLDTTGGRDVCLVDTLAFCSGESDFNKFTIVSVADSTRPRLIGKTAAWGWSYGIWASGLAQSTFLGCHWEGLQVYDTRNISAPARDTFLLGSDMAVDVCIDNDRAYVATEKSGLKILDVSDQRKPTTLGSYDTAGQAPVLATAVALDSFVYIGWPRPKFRSVDVTNPSNPVYAGTCELFGYPGDMVIRDSLVYVVEDYRFQVVNVARPREPVLVGSCLSGTGQYFEVVLQETLAYVAGGGALQIISIACPSSPYIVGTGGLYSIGLAIRDTLAYIPYVCDTLLVYSIADPTDLRKLSAVPAGVWPSDAALGESKVYVSSASGIDVYDLGNPAQPAHVGSIISAAPALRLNYVGGLLYAMLQEAGVAIYETTAVGIAERAATIDRPGLLRVWPNVTGDKVRFALGATARTINIAMFDVSGKRLRDVRPQNESKGGATEGSIDLSCLAAGVYVVRVESEGNYFTAKVVKTDRR